MEHLSEGQILRFLGEIAVLLIASRTLGDLMKRLGQPAVTGELLAGLLLGPSIFGWILPAGYQVLFPADPSVAWLLEAFAWAGAVILLLYIGLETDLSILSGMGRTVGLISGCGMGIAMVSGLVLGYLVPGHYLVGGQGRLIFALFMAVAISISAVPVIAKILLDLGLMRRDLGMLILAAGIVDDGVGWLLLGIVAGLAEHGTVDLASLGRLVAGSGVFVLFCYFIGVRLVGRILRWVDDRTFIEHGKFSTMVAVAFICAIATHALGIHAVFGAFVAGLMLTRSPRVRKPDLVDLEAATMGLFAPIFFAFSGLKADLTALEGVALPAIVLAVGCTALPIGCALGGRLGGLKWREAMAVALGMNARGGMGIIAALIGLSLGVLSTEVYTVLLLFAVVTSLMTPPLLSWALGGIGERPSETERRRRARLLARMHFSGEGAKLLVLSGGGPHAELAAHIAAAVAHHQEASITVFRALTVGEKGAGQKAVAEEFDAQFARIKAIAERAGTKNVHQRSGAARSVAEAVVQESERGYDAIFAGASHVEGYDDLGGEVLRELVSSARAPVVIVRSAGQLGPFRRVLAPITGAAFSRLAASVAMEYAQAFGARLTALYVREGELVALPGFSSLDPRESQGEEYVEEIRKLGEELGLEVEGRISSGRDVENVILDLTREEEFDLLVMGVLYRSSEQRLYFGPRVNRIVRRAESAVAVVVPPQPAGVRS